jgi:hypothetical protein
MSAPAYSDPKHCRHVRLFTGHTLRTWEARNGGFGRTYLGYEFADASGKVIFEGTDYGCAPSHAIDSDDSLRGLLVFLTLRKGDTDREYFDNYTPEQIAFSESSDCESLQLYGLDDSEEEFENLDGWEDVDTDDSEDESAEASAE